jgi:protein-S-isoprenylcysteine O-methyltransferase Ste14
MDWSGYLRDGGRTADLGVPTSWQEPDSIVVTRREHTLVIDGPYRWVRHPFYGSVVLFVLGMSLIAANWFLLVTGGLVIGLLIIRTRTEEEKLLGHFGDSYRAYVERTGRFVPKIRANKHGA